MIDLTKFAKEVHQNAVEHGWWEPEPSFSQVIALCHSELSEALEEYRAGIPMVWYACGVDKAVCVGAKCEYYGSDGECDYKKDKPEGIAVEMVDCLLRILDYAGKCGWDCEIEKTEFYKADKFNLIECIAEIHNELSMAWFVVYRCKEDPRFKMLRCAGKIITWLEANYGGNWRELLELKHEYNKTREYRHGGKKA